MAKEITLEELAGSVSNNSQSTNRVTSNPKNAGNPVSIEEISETLKKNNNIQDTVTEETPLIQNAFDGMYSTINERVETFEKDYMPKILENAEDMALAEEMGIDTSTVQLTDEMITAARPAGYGEETNISEYNTDDEENYEINNDAEENLIEDTDPSDTYDKPTESDDDEFDSDFDSLDELANDLDDENEKLSNESEDESTEELRARFKESFASVQIAKNPIDLNKFKIRRNAVASSKVLNTVNNKPQQFKRADWVLYYTGRSMTFEEGRGPELDALRKTISGSNAINSVRATLEYIYRHVVDPNKPSFEQWCKLIRTEDIESLYFGIYIACYSDGNLVARTCSKDDGGCGKTSLIDTNIYDMVKFEDDKAKEKFYAIRNKDTTTEYTSFESELLQISDDFVVSYSHPTLYSTFIQYSTLNPKITEKYTDILDTMAYIDGFFIIDRDTSELVPLAIPEYPNNFNKTVLAKIKVYTEILKTLTTDQYNVLNAKLSGMIQGSKVTYIYPETTCPECGTTIPEERIDSILNLLFTRAQLAQVKSL